MKDSVATPRQVRVVFFQGDDSSRDKTNKRRYGNRAALYREIFLTSLSDPCFSICSRPRGNFLSLSGGFWEEEKKLMSSTSRWQREGKRRIGNGPLGSYTTPTSFKLVTDFYAVFNTLLRNRLLMETPAACFFSFSWL